MAGERSHTHTADDMHVRKAWQVELARKAFRETLSVCSAMMCVHNDTDAGADFEGETHATYANRQPRWM